MRIFKFNVDSKWNCSFRKSFNICAKDIDTAKKEAEAYRDRNFERILYAVTQLKATSINPVGWKKGEVREYGPY